MALWVGGEAASGFFQVLPRRRWVVERTFAWLSLWRRLSKEDYERLPETAEAMIYGVR